jgi:predicted GH43/DUF377 family glycosyl hydrolase
MRYAALGSMLLLCAGRSPAQNLWDLFSNTFTTNVLAWSRYNSNPVISSSGTTWKSRGVGGPELLSFKSRTLLFFHGTGVLGSVAVPANRIGVLEVADFGAGRLALKDVIGGLPAIDIGTGGAFDRHGVSTPAAVAFKGQIYLYYTGTADSSSSIGLAVSANGEQFVKIGRVLDGISPDVIVLGDTLYMVFQRLERNGYRMHLAFSTDGRKFYEIGSRPVFEGKAGDWDAQSITTPRIWRSAGWVYVLYGGSAGDVDEPEFFGLARSKDLTHWERHPGNPIFGAGAHGGPDGGAIWTPAMFENDTWIILLYEGSIGHHFWRGESSICMAWVPKR